MVDLLPPWPLFSAFLVASTVLAVTPGPGVLYVVTRSIVQGRRCGLVSVAGVALGNLGNALAAALGLAAVFAVSSWAFAAVKLAGAAYLVFLGWRMLRAAAPDVGFGQIAAVPLSRVFRDGFVVALLNPKTTLFYAAFLPQFLDPAGAPVLRSLLLGTLFVAIAAVTDSAYALAAGAAAPVLRGERTRVIGRRVGAAMFIALGIVAALSGGSAGA
ncbi:MAG: LysE family translocator [Betaproteobacteria bacterium]|nr:LysE family translocator [Betaproteobacteria bacterium]